MRTRAITLALFTLAVLLVPTPARAADTLEQFDRGLTDLDLYFGFGGAGPGVEDRATYGEIMIGAGLVDGLSAFAGVPIHSRKVGAGSDEVALHVETTLGAYLTLGGRHQLLLEYDMSLTPNPLEDQHAAEVGGLALGYNLSLTDSAELISQVYLDLPQEEEPLAVNVMLGVIFTLTRRGA